MMHSRTPFGYVVSIDGSIVTLNLKDSHKGQLAAHPEGVVKVTNIGSLFGVVSGSDLFVLKVRSVKFAEPKDAHIIIHERKKFSSQEPLRYLEANVIGIIKKREGKLRFDLDSLSSPALGAEAYPLSPDETNTVLNLDYVKGESIDLGESIRSGTKQWVGINDLLTRHVAVLGSTGQGKSCFTSAVLQQLAGFQESRIVIFDINGEYEDAMQGHVNGQELKVTRLGGQTPSFKIPYYALGRHGLGRLLLPSERTQRPALNFALENLNKVEYDQATGGTGLANSQIYRFFDDCRPGNAMNALNDIDRLRNGTFTTSANQWPDMRALSCLVAESYALKLNPRNGSQAERNGFDYGNVSPLINRIRRFVEDPMFTSVVDVSQSQNAMTPLNWRNEAKQLVSEIFGDQSSTWKVHIVDLREVMNDLLPFILGALLESLAFELFSRGAGNSKPTLLVLEEAHHYLRQLNNDDTAKHGLAYERLAKEGRKFGVSLWLSTQRPSELSSTVLSQCGTWVSFRLASEADIKAVANASDWVDKNEVRVISGLPRRHAILFGANLPMPTRIISPEANPLPKSHDPDFASWGAKK